MIRKPPVDYQNTGYLVYRDGRVFSLVQGLFLKESKKGGYYYFVLRIKGRYISKYKHRLLAECYIPNPNNLPEVRHKNDNKDDSRLKNLCWGTRADNVQDGIRNKCFTYKGRRRPDWTKLTADQIAEIIKLNEQGQSFRSLGFKFNVSRTTISQIVKKQIQPTPTTNKRKAK